jgi:hypothetical protein
MSPRLTASSRVEGKGIRRLAQMRTCEREAEFTPRVGLTLWEISASQRYFTYQSSEA